MTQNNDSRKENSQHESSSRRSFLTKSAIGVSVISSLGGCTGSNGQGGAAETETGGQGGAAETETGQSSQDAIMTTVGTTENDYWNAFARGANEAARALGYDTALRTHGMEVSSHLNLLNTANTSGFSGVNAFASDAQVRSLARRAQKIGLPMTMIWSIGAWLTPPDIGDKFAMFHMADSVNNGYWGTKALCESIDGEGNVVRMFGPAGATFTLGREAGFKKAVEEYPDVNVLGAANDSFTRKGGRAAMSTLYTQYGDEIDGVFSHHTLMCLGAITVLKEKGALKDIEMTGIDALPQGNKAIENGDLTAAHGQHPPWQGGWAVVALHDYLNGVERSLPERMVMWQGDLIVRDPEQFSNIEYGALEAGRYNDVVYNEDKQTPYDWELMSRAESGDSWDPQNRVRPIRKRHFKSKLFWKESERPDGYSLPEGYDNTELFDKVEQMYKDQYNKNPLRG